MRIETGTLWQDEEEPQESLGIMGIFHVAEVPTEFLRTRTRGQRSWELLLTAFLKFEGTDFQSVSVLIDTGSRVPFLFRPGLGEARRPAPYPIKLLTADDSTLRGGTECGAPTVDSPSPWQTFKPVWGFEAEKVGDCIMGYPPLSDFRLAVDCSDHCLGKSQDNLSDPAFKVRVGDKIAQLILEHCLTLDVHRTDKLADTVPADKGFGHSGVRGLSDWYAYRT